MTNANRRSKVSVGTTKKSTAANVVAALTGEYGIATDRLSVKTPGAGDQAREATSHLLCTVGAVKRSSTLESGRDG